MNVLRLLPALLLSVPLAAAAQTDPGSGSPMNPAASSSNNQPGSATSPGQLRQDSSANGSGGTDAGAMRDRIFLRKAAQGGAAEIHLSQLALRKSESEDIRKFAQKMIEDHQALDDALRPFGEQLGVMPPKAPNKIEMQELDRLTALSGADFDREYLLKMMQDHHRDLHDFRDEAGVTADADLREAVTRGETVIAAHTRLVDKLAKTHSVQAHL